MGWPCFSMLRRSIVVVDPEQDYFRGACLSAISHRLRTSLTTRIKSIRNCLVDFVNWNLGLGAIYPHGQATRTRTPWGQGHSVVSDREGTGRLGFTTDLQGRHVPIVCPAVDESVFVEGVASLWLGLRCDRPHSLPWSSPAPTATASACSLGGALGTHISDALFSHYSQSQLSIFS